MNNKVLIVLVSIFFMLVFFYVTEKISNYIKVRKNSEKYINKLKKRFDKLMSNKDKEKDYNKKMKNLLISRCRSSCYSWWKSYSDWLYSWFRLVRIS